MVKKDRNFFAAGIFIVQFYEKFCKSYENTTKTAELSPFLQLLTLLPPVNIMATVLLNYKHTKNAQYLGGII